MRTPGVLTCDGEHAWGWCAEHAQGVHASGHAGAARNHPLQQLSG